jgi:hypothetical protein
VVKNGSISGFAGDNDQVNATQLQAGMTLDQFLSVIKEMFTRPDVYFLLMR